MATQLRQLSVRIEELERLANEVYEAAALFEKGYPTVSVKGQRWYRGAREILVQQRSSALKEFNECYESPNPYAADIRDYFDLASRPSAVPLTPEAWKHQFNAFNHLFQRARSLLLSVFEEIISREMPIKTQLSLEVAASEFDAAESILLESKDEEVFLRASGVIARVALERHLFTVAEKSGVEIVKNPPSKRKADVSDVVNSLVKENLVSPIQRSDLNSLFVIANNCAHPKEAIKSADVERLIRRGRELASDIL